LDPARFERIQDLFHAAADLLPAARDQFLATVDSDLREELEALLNEDAQGTPLFDQGVSTVAAETIDQIPEAFLGQTFGPYKLERLLGKGGMGLVFLGRRNDLAATAAIKILRDAWLSPARRDRFLREQKTLAELRHPAIATLLDADTLPDGTPWFAMEYVPGVPITDFAKALPLNVRLTLFRRVCEAVQHAHSHAIIHRDLKPSNILVTPEADVKLLDFGIAKQLDTGPAHTRTGLQLLTPAYAAPEQVRGEATGIYTDVYGLGLILYELLAGKLPAGAPPSEARHLQTSAAAWRDLDVLCLTAMHSEPARRYASVEALIRDIDHFLNGQPLDARPDAWTYRAAKFIGRHRPAVAAAALIIFTSSALILFYTLRLRSARNQAVSEAARAQRLMRFVLNLFEGGDQYAGPAKDLRVVTLLDRGAGEARALSADPEAQTELLRTLGGVERKLGNLDKADSLLRQALDQRQRLRVERPAEYAESLLDLALLRADQAKFEEAERLAREGVSLTKQNHPPGHPAIPTALEALGKVLEERGAYAPAIAVLNEALPLRTAPADIAGTLTGLANVHFYAGNYKESEALNQRLLTLHRQLYGPAHPSIAEDLVNLGAIQQDTGNYVEAEKFHRQSLAITRPFFGEDHPRTAAGLTLVARALILQKRPAEALPLLTQALAIRERVFGPVHPQVASTLNELGTMALGGDQFAAAEKHFQRVVSIYREAYAGKHYLISIGLSNLASVYMAQKQFDRAEPLLRESMKIYEGTLSPTHVNVGIGRIKLGRTLLRLKRPKESIVESQAGIDILSKQTNPAVSWLNNAKKDLAEAQKLLP